MITFTSGCLFSWEGARTTRRIPQKAETLPRTDELPGAATLADDGRVRFALVTNQLCQREELAIEQTGIDRQKHFNLGGLALLAASGAAIVTSIWLFTRLPDASSTGPETPLTIAGGAYLAAGGVVGVVVPLVYRYSNGRYPESKGFEKIDEHPIRVASTRLACPAGAAAVGELVLTAPWGGVARARPDVDGIALFALDWTSPRAAELSRDQLSSGWTITSDALKTSARWSPTAADTARVAEYVSHARERVVTGSTPAQLVATIDAAKPIEIGGTGQIVVTVRNDGASTAINVTAKTRSSLSALHGVAIAFGTIQPGTSVTRAANVSVPDGVSEDSATVVVTFTEGSGHAPPDVSGKLPLVRAVCPGGKLTREKYDEKRKKMLAAVKAGDMTQETFDKFDADYVRCLE